MNSKLTLRADVEIQKNPDGKEDEVSFYVRSPDGSPLTASQILEAISESLLLFWDNCPLEPRNPEEFDA